MRNMPSIWCVVVCVVVAASQVGSPAATAQQGGRVRGDLGRAMLQLVNDERAARGIDPLTWDGDLADLADEWSARMARGRRLRHRLRGGDKPPSAAGFSQLVENVSMNSAGQMGRSHALMMASDAHRANLLHPGVTKGGIGVVCDADGAAWITQYFASGPDDPSTGSSPGAPPSEPTVHDQPDAGGSCADPPAPDPAGPDGDDERDGERERGAGGDPVEREGDTAGDAVSSDGDGSAGDPGAGGAPRDAPRTDDDRPRTGCPGGEAPAARFADRDAIPASHRANVDCAVWHAVVSGYPDASYRPSLPVRRDQMATFLVNTLAAAGVELPAPSERRFRDLEGSPHAPAAHRLAAAGIVAGGPQDLPAGAYGPGLTVRRDQLASFLVRALDFAAGEAGGESAGGEAGESGGATRSFRDVPEGNPHSDSVDAAASAGLVAGFADGRYRPAGDVRRDQTATFMVRLLAW